MKHTYLVALGCAALLTFNSCGEDFLYKAPQGSVDKDVFKNPQGIELLVVNTYANLTANNWGASIFNWTMGGMYGGDANKGSDASDQSVLNEMEMYQTLSTNSYLNDKWKWTYDGVQRANQALQILLSDELKVMDEGVKKSRIAELYFLRTLHYFESVKVFGSKIPYIDESITENDPKVHNDIDIYPKLIEDIDKAIAGLPNTQKEAGRVNSWAAKGLKAKMLMQKGDVASAKPILEDLLANGVTVTGKKYGLADDLNDNWSSFKDNTSPESVFEIQFSIEVDNNGNVGMSLCYPYGSEAPGGCCGFYQPSYELANSFQVDANGLPYLDGEYRLKESVSMLNSENVIVNNHTIAVDPRLDFAIARVGIPYKDWGVCQQDWIRKITDSGIFQPKKHVYTKEEEDAKLGSRNRSYGWSPGSAMNIQYLSVRDMMLLYAECLAEAGQMSEAMSYVNQIRKRASLDVNIIKNEDGKPAGNYKIAEYPSSHASFSNKDVCIKAVRMERKLELAMEGQRWFDLARWGGDYMAAQIKAYIDYEKKYISKYNAASYLDANKTMFPIPNTQIQTMGTDLETDTPYLVQPEPWR